MRLTRVQAWSLLVFFLFGFPEGWGSCSPLRFLRAHDWCWVYKYLSLPWHF